MIVVTASVILVPGAGFVGPIPSGTSVLQFVCGRGRHCVQTPEAARRASILNLLAGPAALPVLKSFGMEPGLPK